VTVTEEPGFTLTGTGPVRRLTLDRAHRHNAQTVAMWFAMDRAAEHLATENEVRCVVVSGAGDTFSAGIDLGELADDGALAAIARTPSGAGASAAEGMLAAVQRAFLWPTRAPFLTIAAVEGVAIGAGMELALACDVRIVADTARLRLPEVGMGVVPDLGGCHLLRGLVGYERALDLIVNSRWMSGVEAVEWGVALRHAPPGTTARAAAAYAAALGGTSSAALRHAKAALSTPDPRTSLDRAAAGMLAGLRGSRVAARPSAVRLPDGE
jgi:enoyl-CoA hydratase/carnithine racemase